MSDTSNLQNSLFETMKLFGDYANKTSGSAITVECKILEVVDAGKKEYKVEYIGNTFNVHANNDTTYSVGESVYILVPNGDFTKEKIIIGSVSATTEGKIDDAEIEGEYSDVTDNLLKLNLGDILELSSYGTTKETVKATNNKEEFNKIITNYLKNYRTLALGFTVQTSLDISQQAGGNYGVSIKIPVMRESADGSSIQEWKEITLDVGNMLGNPFRLTAWTPQVIYYQLDEKYTYDSSKEPELTYYCYGFSQDKEKAKKIKDILIKDINLKIVKKVSAENNDGYSLSLKASEGEYFSTNYSSVKKIVPTLYFKGKKTSLKSAEIYWFRENAEVRQDHKKFHPYGGYGWECLNDKTAVSTKEDGSITYEYITNVDSLEVKANEVKASMRYKCVVLYKEKISSEIITLKNLNSIQDIILETAEGYNKYIKDTGFITLSAFVYMKDIVDLEANRNNIKLSWLRYDRNGVFLNDKEGFFEVIKNNEITERDGIKGFLTQVRFHTVEVEDFNTIFCSAKFIKNNHDVITEELIGTKELTVTTSEDFSYALTINEGQAIYKYDADGDSPTGTAYDGPSTSKVKAIKPLSFTLRKADGTELTKEEYEDVKITWLVPKKSMFTVQKSDKDNEQYYIFEKFGNSFKLQYGIASRFNATAAANSTIIAIAEFQGNIIRENTSISFIKEGMSGSNGTAIAGRLVSGGGSASTSYPYGTLDENGVAKKLKFVYNISKGNNGLSYYDYEEKTLKNWNTYKQRIYPMVWKDSQLLTYGTDYTVEYSMFDAKYTNPCFTIDRVDNRDGSLLLNFDSSKISSIEDTPCNIVQAKIKVDKGVSVASADQEIYCYYPIELSLINLNQELSVVPSINGGFAEVMYASDGTNPSYDETAPFSCEDEKLISKDLSQYFSINWSSSNHLTGKLSKDGKTYKVKPDNKYDDGDTKNYVKAKLGFKSNISADLNNKLSAIVVENDKCNVLISKLNENKTYLENFAKAYNRTKWIERLSNIQVFFDRRNALVLKLQDLLKASITGFNDYITLQDGHNKYSLKDNAKVIIQAVALLEEKAKENLEISSSLDGKKYTFDSLFPLSDYHIKWSKELKDSYTFIFGLNTTLTLEVLINNINTAIEEYDKLYADFMQLKNNNYTTVYSEVIAEIESMAKIIPPSAMTQYLAIRENCLLYVVEMKDTPAIKDLIALINKMYDNVIKGVFIEENNKLILSQATLNEINLLKQQSQDTINKNNKVANGYRDILKLGGLGISHIRPIVLYFNRYEMSNINAWDGNKIETGDNEYLLAPQVGAGVKDPATNTFTGMMMGQRNRRESGKTTAQVGLFGYSDGIQSMFLNARNGDAIFGKAGQGGQIVISPNAGEDSSGLIYSSNYWKNYNKDGMPSTYVDTNKSGNGMLLNFSKGEIHLGNAETGKVYSGRHSALNSKEDGFYLDHAGISFGSKFRAEASGKVFVGNKAHLGENTSGVARKCWTIDGNDSNSYISYGGASSFQDAINKPASTIQVYMGTDGIALGKKFNVNADGVLTAVEGHIGGWKMTSTTLETDGTGDTGIILDSKGSIKHKGSKWEINSSGHAKFDDIEASKGGTIGGWKIHPNKLQSATGDIALNNNGSIVSKNWRINTNGVAYFTNVVITGNGIGANYDLSGSQMKWQNFEVDTVGNMKAKNVNIGGTVNASAGSIGNLKISNGGISTGNFSVSGSGILFAKGASFKTAGGGSLDLGVGTVNPSLSGANIGAGGIVMDGYSGITGCPNIGNNNGAVWTFNGNVISTAANLKITGNSFLIAAGASATLPEPGLVTFGSSGNLSNYIKSRVKALVKDSYVEILGKRETVTFPNL